MEDQFSFEALAVGEIDKLKQQIEFLTDLFTRRDATQRATIDQLEIVVNQQALIITWFKAHTAEQPLGVIQ